MLLPNKTNGNTATTIVSKLVFLVIAAQPVMWDANGTATPVEFVNLLITMLTTTVSTLSSTTLACHPAKLFPVHNEDT